MWSGGGARKHYVSEVSNRNLPEEIAHMKGKIKAFQAFLKPLVLTTSRVENKYAEIMMVTWDLLTFYFLVSNCYKHNPPLKRLPMSLDATVKNGVSLYSYDKRCSNCGAVF